MMSRKEMVEAQIQKAKHLLRLRDRAATEGEAKAASFALAHLLERYRISMAEIEEEKNDERSQANCLLGNKPILQGIRVTPWRRRLIEILELHCGVVCLWQIICRPNKKIPIKKGVLFGRKEDLEMMRIMHKKIADDTVYLGIIMARREREIWRLGFVDGIAAQLAEAKKQAQQQCSSSVALTLQNRYEKAKEQLIAQMNGIRQCAPVEYHRKANRWYQAGYRQGKDHCLRPRLKHQAC